MTLCRTLGLLILALSAIACGGGDDDDGGNANTGIGGSSGSGGTTGGSGGSTATTGGSGGSTATTGGGGGTGGISQTLAPCGPGASQNAQGVLTSHPQMSITLGDPSFELETINIIPSIAPSGIDTLDVYGEVTNISLQTRCYLFFDGRLDGLEVLVQAETEPHREEGYSTTRDCVLPGETAVLVGIANNIPAATVNAAATFALNMTSTEAFAEQLPANGAPMFTASIEQGSNGGNLISGTVTTSVDLYNYGMRFYPRDVRGLLVDELLAFPGDLGDIPAGTTLPFSTLESECQFDEYVFLHSWIYIE